MAIEHLEKYYTKLQERISQVRRIRDQQRPLPFGAEIIFEHGVIKGKAELKWVRWVLSQLKQHQEAEQNG